MSKSLSSSKATLSSRKTTDTNDIPLDNRIYKVKQLVKGSIDTIYVFNGKKTVENEEELFKQIFTKEENEMRKREKIPVKFSDQTIHFDDSIGTIKIKILNELKKEISLDEIYLYCQKTETLNAVSVYQTLTQNKKIPLTKVRLEQFISNIVSDENHKPFKKPIDKEMYTFDDIFEMKIDNNKYIINKVLGQKFFIVENEYPFVCNPYEVDEFDSFFEKNARKSLTTLNSHLLLNNGEIIDNSIYLCLAEDVVTYLNKKNDVTEETIIKIYYPFLYNKNITSLEDLERNKKKLIENNSKFINSKTFNSFKTVDLFYNIYNFKQNELNYINRGIKYIKAVIKPEFNIKIPLEIIFKIVHATQNSPLIKYNPSSRQENVYRLFTDKIATDGRKIPYLEKAIIFKLMKTIAKNKSVGIYVETTSNKIVDSIFCEFDEEGYITISTEFKTVMNINEIDIVLKDTINPIIIEIKKFLEQSGYKLKEFKSLNDDNVEIKQLTYETQVKIKKKFDISAYKGCISSIFINETNVKKGNTINLRFKRVSNYSKFNSQEAFILEKSEQGLRGDQIIEELLENFPEDLDREQAVEMVKKIANELEIEHGVRKSDIKIKENPGFKTIMTFKNDDDEINSQILTIVTENINNINYIHTLPIYLDSIVRLTQDKSSTQYSLKEINDMCSKGDDKEISIEDIISSSEESAPNSELPSIDPDEEEVNYTKIKNMDTNKPKGALSLFFDEEDEDEDLEGGGEGSDSEESIASDKSSKKDSKSSEEESLKSLEKFGNSSEEESIPSAKSSKKDSKSSEEESVTSVKSLEKFGNSSEEESIPSAKSSKKDSKSSEEKSVTSVKSLDKFGNSSEEESVASVKSLENFGNSSEEESIPSAKSSKKDSKSSEEESVASAKSSKKDSKSSEEESLKSSKKDSKSSSKASLKSLENLENSSSDESVASAKSSSKEFPIQKKKKEISKSSSSSNKEEESEEEESVERNIDGMKLNKPYYFQTLIEKKDPVLILKEDTLQYNSYPRTCSSNMRRQPVILNDNQLEKIKKSHPGFLREEDVIKYGSNPKNQYNYICPRYWCLKNNTLIQPNELKEVKGKDGKKELVHPTCGKVLPKGEKKVKPGYYIYEFYKPKPGKKDYKKYPGLIPDSHPDGLCLPCCFDKYNTEGRIKANKKCYGEKTKEPEGKNENIPKKKKEEEEEEEEEKQEKKQEKEEDKDYVKGPDKFPLDPGRWGYLPVEIQTMLHEVNADCQVSKTNTNLKENHPCLLRHGIENNDKQSFLACISDVIFYGTEILDENNEKKTAKILSIKEMRERIIKSINIDSFIKYQNGNLVNDFYDSKNKINIEPYKNTKLYKKLDINNTEEKAYYTKVVSSFENFKNYLNDDDAVIDHTYLWDIISMPNKYLFPSGVNLVIFHLPKDDITNNVQLLCPSNHYSNEFYEAIKPTIIIMKEENYYEPIYSYTTINKNQKIEVVRKFKERDPSLSKTMRAVFKEIIKPFFNKICRPLDSMPNVFKAKKAILLYNLVQKLDTYSYKILKLVLNFNNKVIGVLAEEPVTGNKGFVPCYPSALNDDLKKDLDLVFMTDVTLWNTYKNTIQFLNKLDKRSKKRRDEPDIPCKPAFKVVEEQHVVGILTNTNQFIQISKPLRLDEIDPELDDIPSIENDNYIVNIKASPMVNTEVEFTTKFNPNDVDNERVDYIKKIKLETSFYNVFRNTIRILINNYENIKIREKLEKEMYKEYITYSEKLNNINALLRDLIKDKKNPKNDKIKFTGSDKFYELINEVSTCIIKDNKSCKESSDLCMVTENGNCSLILPKKNLITKNLNETIYYGRMADELIRYNRIKSFMLEPQTYLSFGNIGYNLLDNEIILIQSLLTQEYFDNLIPASTNKYVKHISYDESQPVISQIYENTIPSLDHAIGRKKETECNTTINEQITSSIWKQCFPENYKELVYDKYNFCTFNFIIDLIEKKTNNKLTINQLKNELYVEYSKYLKKYINKITDILILEGKKTLGDQVLSGTLSFVNFIYTDNYFLTTLDLWLLVTKYKIPTVFICQKWILQTKYEKHEFVGYGNKSDKFVFINIPGYRPENVPGYKLIQTEKNEPFISLDKLQGECVERIEEAINNKVTIEDYLENFTKPIKTEYNKKKPARLIIEPDSEEEKPKRKKKFIIEETTPISPEEFILKPKKRTKRKIIIKEDKNKTAKKGIRKRKLLIATSSTDKN
jgi:hypothetical protein